MTGFAFAGAVAAGVLAASVVSAAKAAPRADTTIEKSVAPDTKATTPGDAASAVRGVSGAGKADAKPDAKPEAKNVVENVASKPATVSKPQAPQTSLKISVDLTSQRMSVREHGKVIHSWPISSGRSGFATITGNFRPLWMTPMHYSRKYDNAPMPNAIFFKGGFAIHATYATGLLGRPASHGCIRLAPSNARRLYGLVQSHGRQQTAISVYGTAREPAPVVAAKPAKPRMVHSGEQAAWSHYRAPNKPVAGLPPKIIYRNGQAYIYVGRQQAERYWRNRYSGSYSSW